MRSLLIAAAIVFALCSTASARGRGHHGGYPYVGPFVPYTPIVYRPPTTTFYFHTQVGNTSYGFVSGPMYAPPMFPMYYGW